MQYQSQAVIDAVTNESAIVQPMDPADFTDRLDHMVPDKG